MLCHFNFNFQTLFQTSSERLTSVQRIVCVMHTSLIIPSNVVQHQEKPKNENKIIIFTFSLCIEVDCERIQVINLLGIQQHLIQYLILWKISILWEGVGTSNFRTTTSHFFQNVEIVFLVHHYYDKERLSMFWFYLWRQKRSQRQKSKYQLPMAYYLWLPRPVGG